MIPPLTVRPIVFTPHTGRWRDLLTAAGGRLVVDHDGWSVVALGSGRVGVHPGAPDASSHGPVARWALGFETPDLDAFVAATREGVEHAGGSFDVVPVDHGRQLRVTGPDGLTFGIDEPDAPGEHAPAPQVEYSPTPAFGAGADLAVAPLWMTDEVEGAAALLEALGLARRNASHSGNWVDLVAADGLHAVRANGAGVPTAPSAGPRLAHPAVVARAELLRRAGGGARVIDESYGRSLRIDDPDGGAEIWVNETMRDLYGYTGGGPDAPAGDA
ncbi:MAG: VOC family protein [Actinomycetaceae bacterium]